jgi:hypothetical protein
MSPADRLHMVACIVGEYVVMRDVRTPTTERPVHLSELEGGDFPWTFIGEPYDDTYVPPLGATYREIRKVLRPGG